MRECIGIGKIAQIHQPQVKPLLNAFLEGDLYTRDADSKVFIAKESDGKYALTDAITGMSAGDADTTGFSKIGTNNQLRKVLRGAIAQFDLADTSSAVRAAAVKEMLRLMDGYPG